MSARRNRSGSRIGSGRCGLACTKAAHSYVLGANLDYSNLQPGAKIWRVAVEPPDYQIRKAIWEETLAGTVPDADFSRLADTFAFPADRIRQIGALAYSEAALRNPSDPAPTMADVLTAGRMLATPNFAVSLSRWSRATTGTIWCFRPTGWLSSRPSSPA